MFIITRVYISEQSRRTLEYFKNSGNHFASGSRRICLVYGMSIIHTMTHIEDETRLTYGYIGLDE